MRPFSTFALSLKPDRLQGPERISYTDTNNISAIGFSQGGALISSLSLYKPELLKKVAMLASFIPSPVREDSAVKKAAGKAYPSYFIAHGTEDPAVPFSAALESEQFLKSLNLPVQFVKEEGLAHKVGSESLRQLETWLKS